MTQSNTSQTAQQQASSISSLLTLKTLATTVAIAAIILASFASIRNNLPKFISIPVRKMSTTTATATATNNSALSNSKILSELKVTKRPWNARGFADHSWLYTFHTFSFAGYWSPQHSSYGPLRVINEDRVEKGTGFGTHPHAEFLIWSYIVSGTLEHKDSLGNLEYLKRGDVQFTSAGTGVRHSEYNRDKNEEVHFLQIWAKPNIKGLKPHYSTKKFDDSMKQNKLCRIMEYTERAEKNGNTDSIALQSDVTMEASILDSGKTVEHELVADGPRKVYLHVVMTGRKQPTSGGAQIKVGDTILGEGDGAYVDGAKGPGKIVVESVGDKPAEFLLFDMGMEDS
jgi:quercetin 2,3-dioxygenase